MHFKVKLAGILTEVHSLYPETINFMRDYIDDTPQKADITVRCDASDIAKESDSCTAGYGGVRGNNGAVEYAPQYLETLACLRKIAEQLPLYDRFLFHGAAVAFKERGFLFAAASGVGKSTHIQLWKRYLGADVDIINGDKPFLAVDTSVESTKRGGVTVYGNPWAGKEGWHKNTSALLEGICFIEQGHENVIRRLTAAEGLVPFMRQIYLPQARASAVCTLDLSDRVLNSVPLWHMKCNISESAVRCSFEAMTGLNYDDYKVKRLVEV